MSEHGIARDQLRAFIERIERLEEEKKAIADDIKEVKAEAKGSGFSVPIINEIIKIRKMDRNDRAEREVLLDMYLHALGMAPDPDGDDDGPRGYRPDEEIDAETGEVTDTSAKLVGTIATAMQTDIGRRALTSAIDVMIEREEHEPQPSLMAGKAAASIPPEVAAGNSEAKASVGNGATVQGEDSPDNSVSGDVSRASDGADPVAPIQPETAERGAGPETAPASDGDTTPPAVSSSTPFQSSDLHDGRLQAVPAPALDESRDSAAGVEAPAAPVLYPAPGIVTYERCPPEPVRWHEYADCFPETEVLLNAAGVQRPIVKIGNVILDGRSRYHAARDAGIEYPVVQYAGPDPLTDMIRWNLESRNMSEKDKRAVASRLTKLVPDRADEIMVLFGLEMAEEMA